MKVFVAHNVTHHIEGTARGETLAALLARLRESGLDVCDPEETTIPHDQYADRFEYCLREIASSDVLIVEATDRLGLGVGAEMMFAKQRQISVYVICPGDSYYKRPLSRPDGNAEWLHPFIYGLSTKVFGSVDECIAEIALLVNKS
ncbi:MAG TPA: hypothetical protein VFB01_00155 [Burkholderiales bacterium]|nr:hypothetical protein [Burkholderiales bacterium]